MQHELKTLQDLASAEMNQITMYGSHIKNLRADLDKLRKAELLSTSFASSTNAKISKLQKAARSAYVEYIKLQTRIENIFTNLQY